MHNGHRKRLKERFIKTYKEFTDYELLEMLLFHSFTRKDVKPLAKDLLKVFGSIKHVIYAPENKLMSVNGVGDAVICTFKMVQEISRRIQYQNIEEKNVISSWSTLLQYLKSTIGMEKSENFRILFLNKKNNIIADEIHSVGTIDHTAVYIREIIKRAIFHDASALILVHNHPSGDPSPSKDDIFITKELMKACLTFNIVLRDHVIVTENKVFSFKNEGMI